MDHERLDIRLPGELHHALLRLARARDVTPGQVVRDLLSREISKATHARPSMRADERLVAPLRARLAGDLAHASGWADLDARLRAKGYVLRAAGGGLALHDWPGDRRICKASELGFSYSKLMHRFGRPFPGHPHAWLAERLLAPEMYSAPPGIPESALEEDDDFEVIERF